MDYTIIGNNVNLATRCKVASAHDYLLIDPDTYRLVTDEIECVEAGTYEPKGMPHSIKGYNPIKVFSREKKADYIKITEDKEIIFNNENIDVKKLNTAEKQTLLLNPESV